MLRLPEGPDLVGEYDLKPADGGKATIVTYRATQKDKMNIPAPVSVQKTAIKDAFANKPVSVDCGCNKSYYAYVYPTQPYKIYVCNAFWSAPLAGTDSKGGTLIHEMSHFNAVAGTDDWAYGQSAAASLAISNAAKAVDNADNHEYFGENTPALN